MSQEGLAILRPYLMGDVEAWPPYLMGDVGAWTLEQTGSKHEYVDRLHVYRIYEN
jgi:hypothetical protein